MSNSTQGLARQSSVHTTKVVLASIFLITFHFTSSVCLCVGYKMKTCTQISDSGFRGKINVVNSGRRAGFSQVKSSPLTRPSPTKRAGPPPYKHPLYGLIVLTKASFSTLIRYTHGRRK